MNTQSVSGLSAVMIAAALLLQALPAMAEIYKYEDRSGNLYFTDAPLKDSSYTLLWRSGNDPRFGSSARIDIAGMKRNRDRFAPLIEQVARREQVQPGLLHAVVRAESAYDPRALSRKGAQGLMQLMPATARRFEVQDSWDPGQNLVGGARYLKTLIEMFDGDLELVLAAYNAGENAVRKYGNQIPPFPETRLYVNRVVSFYQKSRKLAGIYPTIK